jgi:hypothetical protein
VFLSLDFLYTPCADVDAAVAEHLALGAALRWRIRAMDTTVACLQVADAGPALLLADHLPAGPPILVHRVADYAATVAELRAGDALDLHEIEIPPGPCATFATGSGQRLAVYELTRPEVAERFEGRDDR